MTETPSIVIPSPLSDKELLAVGTLVVNWAIAERGMSLHVYTVARYRPGGFTDPFPLAFNRLLRLWRQSIGLLCSELPQYAEIGGLLANKGSELSEKRNAVAHWPASRCDLKLDAGPIFHNFREHPIVIDPPTVQFTADEIMSIATAIKLWGEDVKEFHSAIFHDVIAPSQNKWRGPKLPGPVLNTLTFQTIDRTKATRTNHIP